MDKLSNMNRLVWKYLGSTLLVLVLNYWFNSRLIISIQRAVVCRADSCHSSGSP